MGTRSTSGDSILYAQLAGTPDDYTARIRLVRIVADAGGDEQEIPVDEFGPWDIPLTGEWYAQSYGFPLTDVPFPEPGEYEIQLWLDEFEELLARERIEARE